MEEWLLFIVETRERRAMQQALHALLCAMLGNKEGADNSFSDFTKTIFPEKALRDKAYDERARAILKHFEGVYIPSSTREEESPVTKAFRSNKIQIKKSPRKK